MLPTGRELRAKHHTVGVETRQQTHRSSSSRVGNATTSSANVYSGTTTRSGLVAGHPGQRGALGALRGTRRGRGRGRGGGGQVPKPGLTSGVLTAVPPPVSSLDPSTIRRSSRRLSALEDVANAGAPAEEDESGEESEEESENWVSTEGDQRTPSESAVEAADAQLDTKSQDSLETAHAELVEDSVLPSLDVESIDVDVTAVSHLPAAALPPPLDAPAIKPPEPPALTTPSVSAAAVLTPGLPPTAPSPTPTPPPSTLPRITLKISSSAAPSSSPHHLVSATPAPSLHNSLPRRSELQRLTAMGTSASTAGRPASAPPLPSLASSSSRITRRQNSILSATSSSSDLALPLSMDSSLSSLATSASHSLSHSHRSGISTGHAARLAPQLQKVTVWMDLAASDCESLTVRWSDSEWNHEHDGAEPTYTLDMLTFPPPPKPSKSSVPAAPTTPQTWLRSYIGPSTSHTIAGPPLSFAPPPGTPDAARTVARRAWVPGEAVAVRVVRWDAGRERAVGVAWGGIAGCVMPPTPTLSATPPILHILLTPSTIPLTLPSLSHNPHIPLSLTTHKAPVLPSLHLSATLQPYAGTIVMGAGWWQRTTRGRAGEGTEPAAGAQDSGHNGQRTGEVIVRDVGLAAGMPKQVHVGTCKHITWVVEGCVSKHGRRGSGSDVIQAMEDLAGEPEWKEGWRGTGRRVIVEDAEVEPDRRGKAGKDKALNEDSERVRVDLQIPQLTVNQFLPEHAPPVQNPVSDSVVVDLAPLKLALRVRPVVPRVGRGCGEVIGRASASVWWNLGTDDREGVEQQSGDIGQEKQPVRVWRREQDGRDVQMVGVADDSDVEPDGDDVDEEDRGEWDELMDVQLTELAPKPSSNTLPVASNHLSVPSVIPEIASHSSPGLAPSSPTAPPSSLFSEPDSAVPEWPAFSSSVHDGFSPSLDPITHRSKSRAQSQEQLDDGFDLDYVPPALLAPVIASDWRVGLEKDGWREEWGIAWKGNVKGKGERKATQMHGEPDIVDDWLVAGSEDDGPEHEEGEEVEDNEVRHQVLGDGDQYFQGSSARMDVDVNGGEVTMGRGLDNAILEGSDHGDILTVENSLLENTNDRRSREVKQTGTTGTKNPDGNGTLLRGRDCPTDVLGGSVSREVVTALCEPAHLQTQTEPVQLYHAALRDRARSGLPSLSKLASVVHFHPYSARLRRRPPDFSHSANLQSKALSSNGPPISRLPYLSDGNLSIVSKQLSERGGEDSTSCDISTDPLARDSPSFLKSQADFTAESMAVDDGSVNNGAGTDMRLDHKDGRVEEIDDSSKVTGLDDALMEDTMHTENFPSNHDNDTLDETTRESDRSTPVDLSGPLAIYGAGESDLVDGDEGQNVEPAVENELHTAGESDLVDGDEGQTVEPAVENGILGAGESDWVGIHEGQTLEPAVEDSLSNVYESALGFSSTVPESLKGSLIDNLIEEVSLRDGGSGSKMVMASIAPMPTPTLISDSVLITRPEHIAVAESADPRRYSIQLSSTDYPISVRRNRNRSPVFEISLPPTPQHLHKIHSKGFHQKPIRSSVASSGSAHSEISHHSSGSNHTQMDAARPETPIICVPVPEERSDELELRMEKPHLTDLTSIIPVTRVGVDNVHEGRHVHDTDDCGNRQDSISSGKQLVSGTESTNFPGDFEAESVFEPESVKIAKTKRKRRKQDEHAEEVDVLDFSEDEDLPRTRRRNHKGIKQSDPPEPSKVDTSALLKKYTAGHSLPFLTESSSKQLQKLPDRESDTSDAQYKRLRKNPRPASPSDSIVSKTPTVAPVTGRSKSVTSSMDRTEAHVRRGSTSSTITPVTDVRVTKPSSSIRMSSSSKSHQLIRAPKPTSALDVEFVNIADDDVDELSMDYQTTGSWVSILRPVGSTKRGSLELEDIESGNEPIKRTKGGTKSSRRSISTYAGSDGGLSTISSSFRADSGSGERGHSNKHQEFTTL
ncbi:hypothetical protein HDU93_000511 [Gonapodya sp. JEL0774]|nr:hypothetical protein HDU93_000511 [Gonapodya sp. JEL0774]